MESELIEFALEQQRRFDTCSSARERKEAGHFGTPLSIADFMAGMFAQRPRPAIRILDPGAGVGTLSAGVCARILRENGTCSVYFELWENNPKVEPYLRKTMERCRTALEQAGHRMEYAVRSEDFILGNTRESLFDAGPIPSFDWAILNPPYYKVRKDSPQASVMAHVVHGQPNIYVLFMAVAADLLVPGGQMVAITPRSYFNGLYFNRFRKWFFDRLAARRIHVFESRTDAFRDDAVLQENVILLAEKGGDPRGVTLSSSPGRDFHGTTSCVVPYRQVVAPGGAGCIVRVTANQIEHDIVAAMEALPHRLRSLGLEVSTGPVVTFRSTEFLRDERADDTAPLLWMHNVRPFRTHFVRRNGKPSHIAVREDSKRLLVPAKRYVLLKRFTAKEERRRLVAGVLEATDSYSPWIGLENHLNYLYRTGAELSRSEAMGLAAFFNSGIVDRYFRTISGNTQVNATEVRAMPLPDRQTLLEIGESMEAASPRDDFAIEHVVGRFLRLSQGLIEQICECVP